MIKDHHLYHALQYSILILIFLVTIPLLVIFTDRLIRVAIISGLSLVYLVFGILHHREEKNLTKTIFLEYLAISVLIFVVLISLFR